MIPLSDVKVKKHAMVNQLCGGREFTNCIAALGFTIGAEIKVIQNCGNAVVSLSQGTNDQPVRLAKCSSFR